MAIVMDQTAKWKAVPYLYVQSGPLGRPGQNARNHVVTGRRRVNDVVSTVSREPTAQEFRSKTKLVNCKTVQFGRHGHRQGNVPSRAELASLCAHGYVNQDMASVEKNYRVQLKRKYLPVANRALVKRRQHQQHQSPLLPNLQPQWMK